MYRYVAFPVQIVGSVVLYQLIDRYSQLTVGLIRQFPFELTPTQLEARYSQFRPECVHVKAAHFLAENVLTVLVVLVLHADGFDRPSLFSFPVVQVFSFFL